MIPGGTGEPGGSGAPRTARPVAVFGFVLAGLVGGALWWWAVLRLALVPERTGLLEGVLAAGGWGLGLLPVHVTPHRGPRRGAAAGRG